MLTEGEQGLYPTLCRTLKFKNMDKYSFRNEFLRKYPKRIKILNIFTELLGYEPEWKDITDRNLRDLKDEMMEQMGQNSVRTYMAMLKAVINANVNDENIPSKQYAKILSEKVEPSQAVFLNEEEIERIEEYEPKNLIEQSVKAVFLIECYTGCRHSDAEILSETNIIDGKLTYVSIKTKISCTIPVHKKLINHLLVERKDVSDVTFNDTIRRICKECGINDKINLFRRGKTEEHEKWEYVSSHTGRRSFATNLYLRGADLLSIARLAGHTSIEMTKRYIVGYQNLDNNVMSFFN